MWIRGDGVVTNGEPGARMLGALREMRVVEVVEVRLPWRRDEG